jgi:hypothetical protein
MYWGAENYASGNKMAVRSIVVVTEPRGCEKLLTESVPNLPVLLELLETDYHVAVERGTAFFK